MDQKETPFLKGSCLTMCPHSEIELRLKLGLGHKLEKRIMNGVRAQFADPQLMIKEFARSSAGHEIKPSDVRSIPVLVKTVKYLFTVICSLEDISWQEIYDFVSNRLRAVHQDIVVQGTFGNEVIGILIAAARFYVYSNYRLCNNEVFDSHLNFQRFREVMLTLIPKIKEHLLVSNNEINLLTQQVNSLSISKEFSIHFDSNEEQLSIISTSPDCETRNKFLDEKECKYYLTNTDNYNENYCNFQNLSLCEEIISLHMLTNIGKPQVILDILEMPKTVRTDAVTNITKTLVSYLCGNHLPLVRLSSRLPPLLATALAVQLNEIQRVVLGSWSVAYNSVNLCFAFEDLQKLLLFSSKESLVRACYYYGISTSEAGVKFIKGNFNWNVSVLPPEKADWVEEKLNIVPITQILLEKIFKS